MDSKTEKSQNKHMQIPKMINFKIDNFHNLFWKMCPNNEHQWVCMNPDESGQPFDI